VGERDSFHPFKRALVEGLDDIGADWGSGHELLPSVNRHVGVGGVVMEVAEDGFVHRYLSSRRGHLNPIEEEC
jgi:hypothetical protein